MAGRNRLPEPPSTDVSTLCSMGSWLSATAARQLSLDLCLSHLHRGQNFREVTRRPPVRHCGGAHRNSSRAFCVVVAQSEDTDTFRMAATTAAVCGRYDGSLRRPRIGVGAR